MSEAAAPTIIIDTREQTPWEFPGAVSIRAKLDAGDYSVEGLERRVAVERKSLSDAYGTFGGGRDRFERELARLQAMEWSAVIIEASMAFALLHPPERVEKFTPKHFNRTWIAWAQRFDRVHFMFCDCRELAARQCYLLLERFWRDCRDGKRPDPRGADRVPANVEDDVPHPVRIKDRREMNKRFGFKDEADMFDGKGLRRG